MSVDRLTGNISNWQLNTSYHIVPVQRAKLVRTVSFHRPIFVTFLSLEEEIEDKSMDNREVLIYCLAKFL